MGQRDVSALPERPSGKTWDDVIQCEVDHDEHEVRPPSWPPKRTGNMAGDPTMSLRCVRCNTNLIVYAAHATGEMRGVKVILPKSK